MHLKLLAGNFFSIVADSAYLQVKCIIAMSISTKTTLLATAVCIYIRILIQIQFKPSGTV